MVTRVTAVEAIRRAHRTVGLLLMVVLFTWLSTQHAGAHAALLSSTPGDGEQLEASPTEFVLVFSEPVGFVDGAMVLHSPDSGAITLEPESRGASVVIPFDGDLNDGAYILQWRVVSADSHPISGTISFGVGDADLASVGDVSTGAPGWIERAQAVATGLKYLGLLASLGLLLVGWRIVPNDFDGTLRLASKFAVLAFITIAAEILFAAMNQRGEAITDLPRLWSAIGELESGVRIAAGIGLAAIATGIAGGRLLCRWSIPTVLLLIAVLTLLLSGHTRSREPMWLMMLSDTAHVLTVSVWIGGIVLLTLGLRGRWAGEGFATDEASFAAVSRFSTLAGGTAIVVITSGVAMAVMILDTFDPLVRTDYGIALLFKIGLVIIVLIVAAANRFWLIPAKKRDADFSMTRLRRLVTTEFAILIAVVGLTGWLVQQDPNIQVQAPVTTQSAVVVYEDEAEIDANHTIRLKITSRADNRVTVVATVIDADRNIVLPDANLNLSWFLPEKDLGPLNQELFLDSTTGAYVGEFSLPSAGEWEIGVQVRIDRFTDSRTTINLTIPE